MASPARIQTQINKLISYLVEAGLADDQKFALWRSARAEVVRITFEGAEHTSVALRDRGYDEIYLGLVKQRAYNVRMLDGALIQMMYEFTGADLQRHRLAFFPAPNLEKFQNDPEIPSVARSVRQLPHSRDFAGCSGAVRRFYPQEFLRHEIQPIR